ncbi:carbohydrate kinase family protein [Patescibacteria group bacterium]|nr:carbohydrate kinase family protein [Patescibacteria group bacterium]
MSASQKALASQKASASQKILPQIILTGSVAIDHIMVFPGKFEDVIQPDKLHILSISVLLDELRETRGGVAANIAYNLGLLGQESVLLAAVGEDARGFMNDLSSLGVNIDYLHYAQSKTASFSVITDQNDCQVGGFYPGAMSDARSLSLQRWQNSGQPWQNSGQYRQDSEVLVVISPHDPAQMSHQVQECQKFGLKMLYDVGQQVNNLTQQDLRAGVESAELLIMNDYELGSLIQKTGWSQAQILKKVGLILVTLGEKGVKILQAGAGKNSGEGESLSKGKNSGAGERLVKAVKIKKVVDPTGAGDAFRAGFLYGYVRKWDVIKSAQLGCVVASFAVTKYGTQEHKFNQKQLIAIYQETYGKKIVF